MKRQLERLTILMSSIALIVPLVGVAPVVSANTNAPEQIDTDSSVGDASVAAPEPGIADGSLATVPGGLPSQAAMDAAAANDLIEECCLGRSSEPRWRPDRSSERPVDTRPSRMAVKRIPLANTAPQALPKASKTASPIYRAPVAGTVASFSMTEVSPAGARRRSAAGERPDRDRNGSAVASLSSSTHRSLLTRWKHPMSAWTCSMGSLWTWIPRWRPARGPSTQRYTSRELGGFRCRRYHHLG